MRGISAAWQRCEELHRGVVGNPESMVMPMPMRLAPMSMKPRQAMGRCHSTMSGMDWQEVIRQWRALPEQEKLRLSWRNIPFSVARSMAFEGEPVDLAMLEAAHALRPIPQPRKAPATDCREPGNTNPGGCGPTGAC